MRHRPLCGLCLALLLIRFIYMMASLEASENLLKSSPLVTNVNEGEVVTVRGRLHKKEKKETYQLLYLKETSIQYGQKILAESRLLIYDSTFQNNSIGNIIEAKGEVQYFDEAHNPGNFDQRFYYAKQELYGSIRADSVKIVQHDINRVMQWIYSVREKWKQNLYQALGKENGAVLCAMILGDKQDLDTELKESYQKNGIGHILAVSGLHVSFIGVGLYQLIRKRGAPFWVAGIVGSLFLLVYILMVGLGVSSVRAFVMFIIRIGADVSGRVYDMATSLAVAAVVIVLWRPLSIFDAGFLLSFGAILGLLLITPAISNLLPCRKWLDGLYASVGINLMLFPIQIYFYYEFPPYSFFLNLIVIPLMSFIMGIGMIGSLIFIPITFAGTWVLKCCTPILWLYETLCDVTGTLPFARVVFGRPKIWQILLYYILLSVVVIAMHYKGESKSRARRLVYVGIIAVGVIVCSFGHGKRGEMEVVMIDVGQGDGIFVRGPTGKTYLFDGGSSDVKEVGKYRIEPFLESQGVGTIDYVFLSHGDADHMNGVEEMIERQHVGVKVKTLVLPVEEVQDDALLRVAKNAMKQGIRVVTMKAGQALTESTGQKKELRITCLQPTDEYTGEVGNASSMVHDVTFGSFDMLMTGDVEGVGEEQLTENPALRQYDVLKVAHHGSKNSTREEFMEKVEPAFALISAGEENRYGHPHKETIQKLKEKGCKIYSTKESGAILLWTDGERVKVKKYGK